MPNRSKEKPILTSPLQLGDKAYRLNDICWNVSAIERWLATQPDREVYEVGNKELALWYDTVDFDRTCSTDDTTPGIMCDVTGTLILIEGWSRQYRDWKAGKETFTVYLLTLDEMLPFLTEAYMVRHLRRSHLTVAEADPHT